MGSERKSRKRRSSSASPPPSQDEDERSRKHRKRDERDGKRPKDVGKEKKAKKSSKSEKKSERSRSRERKEKKSGDRHKKKGKPSLSLTQLEANARERVLHMLCTSYMTAELKCFFYDRIHLEHDVPTGKKLKKTQELNENDYFSKNAEFSTWLKEERGIFFSDLSSEAARDLFSRFVKDWNREKLEDRYYKGIDRAPRTSHNWKIRPEKVSEL